MHGREDSRSQHEIPWRSSLTLVKIAPAPFSLFAEDRLDEVQAPAKKSPQVEWMDETQLERRIQHLAKDASASRESENGKDSFHSLVRKQRPHSISTLVGGGECRRDVLPPLTY